MKENINIISKLSFELQNIISDKLWIVKLSNLKYSLRHVLHHELRIQLDVEIFDELISEINLETDY